ncbi:Mechanosensitive ion channel protein 5 [Acorus calamus]|uniref:Mechanosensitive ion channel protein n=1 Tax=Acorus calamus TaxID=4465 RepID=A0AAV9CDW4_ACOCL|nr:Mechanosensitive ion channel protein 5 [Acorus calamus]
MQRDKEMHSTERGRSSSPALYDQVVLVMSQHDPQSTEPRLTTTTTTESPNHNPSQRSPRPTPAVPLNLVRLASKPKSRFVELNYPLGPQTPQPHPDSESDDDYSDDEDYDEEEEEGDPQSSAPKTLNGRKKQKVGWRTIIEWSAFVSITACLICSLTVGSLRSRGAWGLELWKWCVMVLVTFCGRLLSRWLIAFLVFIIERTFLFREKVLYFVYGLRKSVQNVVWLGLVLLSWTLLFHPEENNGTDGKNRRILKRFSRILIAALIGSVIWLVKIILVKVLASEFHVSTFFDRMKESVFHHYILETLSSPADQVMLEENHWAEEQSLRQRRKLDLWKRARTLPKRLKRKDAMAAALGAAEMPSNRGSRRIDMERLKRLTREGTEVFSVKRLVSHVMSRGLSTISKTVDEFGRTESEITSELEARNTADRVFKNVAKKGQKYIEEDDLLKFLKVEEVRTILPLFAGAAETRKIKRSAFRDWVVRAYRERKSLAHALNDTKTAVHQLHKLASAIVVVIIIVETIMVMGLATSKVLLVVSSQLLLIGFVFQNTCKVVFESIVFVFVMHPFDVGDRCVIDGVQMIVEEMNILNTVFVRFDYEKIYYPNAVLLSKPISNFYRSPHMMDIIDFSIDVATPAESISSMKKSVQTYIENKSKHWHPKHSIIFKEIENVNKMKMALIVTHTMNHQDFGEKNSRRSELIFELKNIFERLGIKYNLLPQEVHLTQHVMAQGRIPPPPNTNAF